MAFDQPTVAMDEAAWLRDAARWLGAAIAQAEERNTFKDELFGLTEDEQAVVRLTLVVSANRAWAIRDGLAGLAIKLRRR